MKILMKGRGQFAEVRPRDAPESAPPALIGAGVVSGDPLALENGPQFWILGVSELGRGTILGN